MVPIHTDMRKSIDKKETKYLTLLIDSSKSNLIFHKQFYESKAIYLPTNSRKIGHIIFKHEKATLKY